MKLKFSSLLALSALSAVILMTASCKKSNSSSNNGQISATVNGTAWATTVATTGIYSSAGQEFEIAGLEFKGGDSTAISLVFFTPFTVNRGVSSDTAYVDVSYVDAKTLVQYDGGLVAGHSLLTVTAYDSVNHKISGTFSGVLYNISGGTDSIPVTSGSFNSSYIAQ